MPGATVPAVVEPTHYFREAYEEIARMEEELSRAVVVTIAGTRPQVDLADAAAAMHMKFGIDPVEMSIRAFFHEDFIVVCWTQETRDRMVALWHRVLPRCG